MYSSRLGNQVLTRHGESVPESKAPESFLCFDDAAMHCMALTPRPSGHNLSIISWFSQSVFTDHQRS